MDVRWCKRCGEAFDAIDADDPAEFCVDCGPYALAEVELSYAVELQQDWEDW